MPVQDCVRALIRSRWGCLLTALARKRRPWQVAAACPVLVLPYRMQDRISQQTRQEIYSMRNHRSGSPIVPAAELLTHWHLESLPWRQIAVDAGLLALFLLTSSWFARG
jgi:hypothetical protein